MAHSPDNSKIVTAASDETIRFWEIFKKNDNKSPNNFFKNSFMSE
jgi:WD40 repeat protein